MLTRYIREFWKGSWHWPEGLRTGVIDITDGSRQKDGGYPKRWMSWITSDEELSENGFLAQVQWRKKLLKIRQSRNWDVMWLQKTSGWGMDIGWKRNQGVSQAILQLRKVVRWGGGPTTWISLQGVGIASENGSGFKCRAYIDLSLDLKVHRNRTVTTDTHTNFILKTYWWCWARGWDFSRTDWDFSRPGTNINNLRYAGDTTLIAESEELKSLLMKVKEKNEKVGLKLNIQTTKIMALGPITSWQIEGEK